MKDQSVGSVPDSDHFILRAAQSDSPSIARVCRACAFYQFLQSLTIVVPPRFPAIIAMTATTSTTTKSQPHHGMLKKKLLFVVVVVSPPPWA
jgi:hypothetical protein